MALTAPRGFSSGPCATLIQYDYQGAEGWVKSARFDSAAPQITLKRHSDGFSSWHLGILFHKSGVAGSLAEASGLKLLESIETWSLGCNVEFIKFEVVSDTRLNFKTVSNKSSPLSVGWALIFDSESVCQAFLAQHTFAVAYNEGTKGLEVLPTFNLGEQI